MSDQAVGLVLGRNRDTADSRVHRIGQGKIDDSRFAAEMDRRLGAPVGKLQKPASAPARKNEGEGVARKRFVYDGGHLVLPGASKHDPRKPSLVRKARSRASGPIVAG